MLKNNYRRDLPVLSYYKPSQFNQGHIYRKNVVTNEI